MALPVLALGCSEVTDERFTRTRGPLNRSLRNPRRAGISLVRSVVRRARQRASRAPETVMPYVAGTRPVHPRARAATRTVRPPVGRLDGVRVHMGQGLLAHLGRRIRALRRPVPQARPEVVWNRPDSEVPDHLGGRRLGQRPPRAEENTIPEPSVRQLLHDGGLANSTGDHWLLDRHSGWIEAEGPPDVSGSARRPPKRRHATRTRHLSAMAPHPLE